MKLMGGLASAFALVLVCASCSGGDEPADISWGARGVCEDVQFWATSEDETVAVVVRAEQDHDRVEAVSLAFAVPDDAVVVEIRNGERMTELFCNDAYSRNPEVTSIELARTAKGEIHLGRTDRWCTEVRGSLSIRSLTGLDGLSYPPLEIDARGVGCSAGG